MAEDKTFELMTKMYSEFSNKFETLEKGQGELKDDVKGLKKDVLRIETKLYDDSKALFDGYKQNYEKLLDVENKVDIMSSKLEKHDNEIKVIKGGKALNV